MKILIKVIQFPFWLLSCLMVLFVFLNCITLCIPFFVIALGVGSIYGGWWGLFALVGIPLLGFGLYKLADVWDLENYWE
jgi:hypothetical protein